MVEGDNGKSRSGDLSWYMKPIVPRCWFCMAENPRGSDTLGGRNGQGGTRIPVCATGEGCRDGKVRHGPQGAPHWPEEDCPICGPGDRQRAERRNSGRVTGVSRAPRNRRRPR